MSIPCSDQLIAEKILVEIVKRTTVEISVRKVSYSKVNATQKDANMGEIKSLSVKLMLTAALKDNQPS